MSQKKRVSDLAKEIGMPGAELLKKLREWGFDIKSAQTGLAEFEELQIRGKLEALNMMGRKVDPAAATQADELSDVSGGLIVKKKKKKLDGADDAGGEAHEAPAEATAAPAHSAPEVTAPSHAVGTPPPQVPVVHPADSGVDEPAEPEVEIPRPAHPAPISAAGTTAPARESSKPSTSQAGAVPASAGPAGHTPAGHTPAGQGMPARSPAEPAPHGADTAHHEPPAATEPPTRNTPPAAAPLAPAASAGPASQAPAPATGAAPTTPAAPGAPPAAGAAPAVPAGPPGSTPLAPSVPPTRQGKVVGFIDLSKLATQPRRPTMESRRLRSKDDVAPDVRPTLGAGKKGALVRGDRGGARDTMTASQLRDREAGRFLRRNALGGQGGPGRPGYGGPGRPRRGEGLLSPLSGKSLEIEAPVTLKKLAEKLSVKPNELVKVGLQNLGLPLGALSINAVLDEDTAVLMAQEYNVDLKMVQEVAAETALIEGIKKKRTGIDAEQLVARPPTVAFMGHVDHGKTTLIDAIRNSRVADGESGGITQHIGAYQVATKKGHKLTIIDTPGHAAFTAMRARGANAVDIVVLVVAADDGPMPSTEEALAHARAAKVPLVVALTKIDKADANLQKAKENLTKLQLIPEEWGGDTAMIPVSALKGTGVEDLLERVFLESEVLQLKSHPRGPAKGIVLEAEINAGKGIVAHLLVQDGTLKRGDVILAGEGYGKVRAMFDDRGRAVDEAPPAMPIEVTGLSALPSIGEAFYVVESLAQAKEVATEREKKNRAVQLSQEHRQTVTAESLMKAVADKARKTINLVVRADVQGSVEVLKNALSELKHDEVEVKVLLAGVGQVTENDINLAGPGGAIVIAFHVGTNDKARTAAERLGVEVRYYEVIYELLDHIRLLMEGVLAPEMSEEILGHVEVRALFKSSKIGTIAGSHVTDGSIIRDSKVRVLRDGRVVHSGQLGSLRREKDDAKEVRAGFDCGITIKDWQDIREGDVVEAYKIVTVKRTLGSAAVS
ncbi:MAG: translation initiation factor IF-2 [Planctomycetota bacterium]|nr:translation initiation factor IF-2 [Planctomycetota bacterium]